MNTKNESPITISAKILGARWTLQIIYQLRQARHFRELQELVGGVNPTTLSQRLRFLEQEGLINRMPISAFPRRVDYNLTEKGEALLPILEDMGKWADKWVTGES